MENKRNLSLAPIIAGAIAFVIGLVLGKDQGDAHTASNIASMILLTVGFLAVVIGLALLGIRSLLARRRA